MMDFHECENSWGNNLTCSQPSCISTAKKLPNSAFLLHQLPRLKTVNRLPMKLNNLIMIRKKDL